MTMHEFIFLFLQQYAGILLVKRDGIWTDGSSNSRYRRPLITTSTTAAVKVNERGWAYLGGLARRAPGQGGKRGVNFSKHASFGRPAVVFPGRPTSDRRHFSACLELPLSKESLVIELPKIYTIFVWVCTFQERF